MTATILQPYTAPRNAALERKILALDNSSLDDNCLKGFAAGIGNMDQGGDVIFPGAFDENCLKDFLANGFLSDHHDWTSQLGMPTVAEERGNKLYTESIFHTTPDAQSVRTKCQERMARGLSVGLSIGFDMLDGGWQMFASGKALLDFARTNGYNIKLFDTASIIAWKGSCRAILHINRLYEYAYAIVQMNRQAVATEVKGQNPMDITNETKPEATEADTSSPGNETEKVDKSAAPAIVVKSQYLGNVEVGCTMAVLSRLNSALQSVLYGALYQFDDDSLDDMIEEIQPAFDEFRDLSIKSIRALLADIPPEELREQAGSYYYYYSQPPEKRAELKTLFKGTDDLSDLGVLTFSEHVQTLGTALGVLTKRATWVRETRLKAGRKLSRETREEMKKIHGTLTVACDDLLAMAEDETDAPLKDSDGDSTKGADAASEVNTSINHSPQLRALELSLLADEAQRLMTCA